MKLRLAEKEKLDDLYLQGETLHKALQSLEWINRWLGNHWAVIKAIHRVYKKEKKTLRIIDLGCGGGDLALAVAKSCRKHKIKCSITGIDGNAHTLVYAQKKCRSFHEINFLLDDILDKEFSMQPCDILISSHFMYHFSDDALIEFLRNNLSSISTAVIFSELKRNRLALCLFKLSNFLLPVSKMAKEDGLVAIKRSFTTKEWISIIQEAGIGSYRIQNEPLFRILLTIFTIRKV
jgi:2-polyprenyl-3-methyl-5-hydroxy-6-metoxy-1,4-benzoquinol methylase